MAFYIGTTGADNVSLDQTYNLIDLIEGDDMLLVRPRPLTQLKHIFDHARCWQRP